MIIHSGVTKIDFLRPIPKVGGVIDPYKVTAHIVWSKIWFICYTISPYVGPKKVEDLVDLGQMVWA